MLSCLCLTVKPNPPENVTVAVEKSGDSTNLHIRWEHPYDTDTKSGWVTLKYGIRVKQQNTSKWKVSFRIQNWNSSNVHFDVSKNLLWCFFFIFASTSQFTFINKILETAVDISFIHPAVGEIEYRSSTMETVHQEQLDPKQCFQKWTKFVQIPYWQDNVNIAES